jgi:hypothetical protein
MGYFLFLRGYGRADPEGVKRLAQGTGLSPADARLSLASRFPRSLSSHADFEQAAAALEKLQAQGFEGFLAEHGEIERAPGIAEVGRAELQADAVSWWHAHRQAAASSELGDVRDRTIHQTREHVRAVFRVSIRSFVRTEHRVTRTSNIQGISVSDTRTEGVSTEGDREQALLVKGVGYDSFVLVSERTFNFSCLGPERVYGPGANIARLATRLRELFPQAFHDESLLQFTGEMGFSFKSSTQAAGGPIAESSAADHHSNFNSVIHMARLLSMQHGLG